MRFLRKILPRSESLSSGSWEENKVCAKAEENCPDPTSEEDFTSVWSEIESEVETEMKFRNDVTQWSPFSNSERACKPKNG